MYPCFRGTVPLTFTKYHDIAAFGRSSDRSNGNKAHAFGVGIQFHAQSQTPCPIVKANRNRGSAPAPKQPLILCRSIIETYADEYSGSGKTRTGFACA